MVQKDSVTHASIQSKLWVQTWFSCIHFLHYPNILNILNFYSTQSEVTKVEKNKREQTLFSATNWSKLLERQNWLWFLQPSKREGIWNHKSTFLRGSPHPQSQDLHSTKCNSTQPSRKRSELRCIYTMSLHLAGMHWSVGFSTKTSALQEWCFVARKSRPCKTRLLMWLSLIRTNLKRND